MPNLRPTHTRFHGDPARFERVAALIWDEFGRAVRHVADVAGGQGMLARVLRKRYGYHAEVVDERGWTLRGVASRRERFDPALAEYYDLIVGLHPDGATRAVAEAALVRPVVLVPCCNFWDRSRKLGSAALLEEIEAFYRSQGVSRKRVTLGIRPPANVALVSSPSC